MTDIGLVVALAGAALAGISARWAWLGLCLIIVGSVMIVNA